MNNEPIECDLRMEGAQLILWLAHANREIIDRFASQNSYGAEHCLIKIANGSAPTLMDLMNGGEQYNLTRRDAVSF